MTRDDYWIARASHDTTGGNVAGKADHRGFGHVRKLPSGRWQASYIGPDLARHNAPTTYEDKDAAVVWLRNERVLIESDDAWRPPKQRAALKRRDSFASYAEAWIPARRVKGRPLRPRTVAHYRKLLDEVLMPPFGAVAVRDLSPTDVSTWFKSLDAATPTKNAHAYSLLHAILATAVDEDIISRNPCRVRGAGQSERASITEPASLDELATIVENVPERFRLMVLLAAWCALRFGELTELRRSDFNRDRTVVSIHRAIAWAEGQQVIGDPKSNAGRRDVAIPPHLVPVVKGHLRGLPVAGRDALLFPSATDPHAPMRQSTLQRAYYPAREAAGRPDLRFHDLRHTGAVLAAATGATLAELMGRLGHSTQGAAMRYQHRARGRDAEIAALLSKLAEGATK